VGFSESSSVKVISRVSLRRVCIIMVRLFFILHFFFSSIMLRGVVTG
jgi:hypothetical protein